MQTETLEKFLKKDTQTLIPKIQAWANDYKVGKIITSDGRMFNTPELASRHQTVCATKGIIVKVLKLDAENH